MSEHDARRSIAGWCHYLNDPDARLSLDEFMAKCLLDLRDNAVVGRLATEHVEGMLGSLEETLVLRDPLYRELASKRAASASGVGSPSAPLSLPEV